MMQKKCSRCGQEKPATREFFVPHKGCRGGVAGTCRACSTSYSRAWKKRNAPEISKRRREQYAADHGAKHKAREEARQARQPLLTSARRLQQGVWERSRTRGQEISPEFKTKAYFADWLTRQPNCPCCGALFAIGNKKGSYVPESPSIDRFDRRFGYVIGNVALICITCNMVKREFTATRLRQVADWMEKFDAERPHHPAL